MTAKVLTPCVDDDQARPQTLLKRFWETSALFWRSERRFAAWMLTILLLLVVGMVVGAAYAMNVWNRAMFDALQNRNGSSVASLSLLYFAILLISVALGVLQVFVRMTLQRRWRSWLNDQLIDRWMASGVTTSSI